MRKSWTVNQLVILRLQYPYCSDLSEMSTKLGKSVSQIKAKASVLKMKTNVRAPYKRRKPFVRKVEPPQVIEDMKKYSIEDASKRLAELEDLLTQSLSLADWKKATSEYHALCVKISQMKGERVDIYHTAPDHII